MDNQQELKVPPPHDELEMLKFLLDTLRTQGLSFLLLGVAVWYLQSQNMELRRDVLRCQETQLQWLTSKNEGLTSALEANTAVLGQISLVLKPKR